MDVGPVCSKQKCLSLPLVSNPPQNLSLLLRQRFHSSLKSLYQEIPLLLCKVIIYELNPLLLITIFNFISCSLVSPSVLCLPNCCYQSVLILKITFQSLFLFCPHSVSRGS